MFEDQREFETRTREQHGLRADRAWVEWVAEHGTDGGMMLNIPLADAEFEELRSRHRRATAAFRAFDSAALASEAGAWVDQAAGGVVRLLLADPIAADQAVAEEIVAEHGGTVELVAHTTRELGQVVALVRDEHDARSEFGRAAVSWGIDVWANVVSVTLRGNQSPETPESLRAAVQSGQLLLYYPAALDGIGWGTSKFGGGQAAADIDTAEATWPRWQGDDRDDWWDHWHRCARYVEDRCVGGPLDTAQRLAEEIGLSVRVIGPDSGYAQHLRSGRATIFVDDHGTVLDVRAE